MRGSTAPTPSRRAPLLLALGAATGLVLAAAGLVGQRRTDRSSLPPSVVARVNGEPISTDDFQQLVAGLAGDRREPIDDQQRRQVLDRLIEEELLLQRALDLGFARKDPRVRADLTQAMIAAIVDESKDLQPSDVELRAFYEENQAFFTPSGALRVRQIFCRAPTLGDVAATEARCADAAKRLRAGEDYATLRQQLGDQELSPLPDTPLPPSKLRDYLGPTALRAVLDLAPGAVSEPVRSGTGFHVLQVVEHQPTAAPPLDAIKTEVLAEYRRRAGDRALRAYLDDLRSRSDVVVGEPLP